MDPLTMSLPGLQISTPEEKVLSAVTHDIKGNTEWRFEVAFGTKVEVKLLSGDAELFGTELAQKQTYNFNGTKGAIFTWHGCQIEVLGECQVEYSAEETPMISYANLHFALEEIRTEKAIEGKEGPRVLILGPENAGKTSLVKLLTAYATKMGRQPVVVNLDPKEGMLSIPGTLSATTFTSIVDVEEGWGSSPTSGPAAVPVKLPLVYFLGLEFPEDNAKVFKPITARLALSVMNRLKEDLGAREAGCLIDTPGSISQGKDGYELVQHIVSEFSANIIVVLGSERLYSDISRRFATQQSGAAEGIAVIKLDRSGGCVDRDKKYWQQSHQAQIREYFFGNAKTTLSPHMQQVDFSQLQIYRLTEDNPLLDSFLPGDASDETSKPPIFGKVEPSPQMQNAVLAIVHAGPTDSLENIRDASVMGFVYVAEVDEKRKKLKILAPLSSRLPSKAFIWGVWPSEVGNLVG